MPASRSPFQGSTSRFIYQGRCPWLLWGAPSGLVISAIASVGARQTITETFKHLWQDARATRRALLADEARQQGNKLFRLRFAKKGESKNRRDHITGAPECTQGAV